MLKSRRSYFVAASLPVLLVSVAAAQDPRAPEPIEPTAGDDASGRPEQRVKTAEAELGEMNQVPTHVRQLLESARDERDVIKVLCLSDKLSQAEAAISSATERMASLRAAVAQGDVDRIGHESTLIGVLKIRVVTLESEANQCVGEEMGFIGENDLKLTIDPGMPPQDASLFPREDLLLLPPPLTSPTT